jgi:polysaccharide pyruvyl transferase WcaK-like protein
MSPFALKYSSSSELAKNNYMNLIQWILNNTDMNILLIPHVEQGKNSDIQAMKPLYEKFRDSHRIALLEWGYNCQQLKYIISKCRFFVGARTHSTIAAYSNCVPTLVMGYSVKARGIARDIFGKEDGFVVQTQNLTSSDELTTAFKKIFEHEGEIRTHLQTFMPGYIEKAWQAREEIRRLLDSYKMGA